MPVNDRIDTDHKPWEFYHDKKDMLDATHSLVDAPTNPLFDVAIVIPDDKILEVMKLMIKEVDAANRFSLTDGLIQGEFEIWDDDYEKRLYFCVDFKLKQAIKLAKQKRQFIGFVASESPRLILGGQQIFQIDDLKKFIRLKISIDTDNRRPNTWKIG